MMDDRKIWVIEDKESPEITSLGEAIVVAPNRPAPRPAPVRQHKAVQAPRPALRTTTTRTRKPMSPVRSAILLAAGYGLGPAALLLTARGRSGGPWMAALAGTTVLTAVLGVSWWAIAVRDGSPSLLGPMLAGSLVCLLMAFTIWAKALQLLVTAQRFAGQPWPTWIRSPWMAGLLGLVAPGSSWVLTRWPQRAAWTVWTIWPAAAGALLLVQAELLWHHRAALAAWGVSADSLEKGFVMAGLVVLAAPLVWLAQAMIGARATAMVAGRWQHGRGDWSALALAAALVAMVLAVEPADLAADLDGGADVLQAAGCQVLPMHLTKLARELDPGQPAYTLQLADLYAARGEDEIADRVREDLARDLRPYVGALVRDGAWGAMMEQALPRRVAVATAAEPAREMSRPPARMSLPGAPWPVMSDAPHGTPASVSDDTMP